MTLDWFAQATINVIRKDGIAEYLPTIVLNETQEFRVIQGIPVTVDHRTAIQNVVRRSGYQSQEFFSAFDLHRNRSPLAIIALESQPCL